MANAVGEPNYVLFLYRNYLHYASGRVGSFLLAALFASLELLEKEPGLMRF